MENAADEKLMKARTNAAKLTDDKLGSIGDFSTDKEKDTWAIEYEKNLFEVIGQLKGKSPPIGDEVREYARRLSKLTPEAVKASVAELRKSTLDRRKVDEIVYLATQLSMTWNPSPSKR